MQRGSTPPGRSTTSSTSSNVWHPVREELLAMAAEDLRVRSELAADGSLFRGYDLRMRAVHSANADRLAAILDRPSASWLGRQEVRKCHFPAGDERRWHGQKGPA